MKIVIPRNRLVPDPGIIDIFMSGQVPDDQGKPLVIPTILYRTKDINFTGAANPGEGMRFWHNDGWIYLPKYASSADWYFAIAKEAATMGISPLLSLGLHPLVGEIPKQLEEAAEAIIGEKIFGEKKSSQPTTYGELADDLAKKGAVSLPHIQLVEIEYQKTPRFLRQPEQRFLYTYERPNGERETYGYKYSSADSPKNVLSHLLRRRQNYEFDHLLSQIKDEQMDTKALIDWLFGKYKSQHGEKWEEHRQEMLEEYFSLRDEEAERKGFNEQRLHAETLQRIASLVPFYRQVPLYSDWVTILEYTAAGKKDEMLKLPMSEPTKMLLFDV